MDVVSYGVKKLQGVLELDQAILYLKLCAKKLIEGDEHALVEIIDTIEGLNVPEKVQIAEA